MHAAKFCFVASFRASTFGSEYEIFAGMRWIIPANEEADSDTLGTPFLTSEDREFAREHFELAAQAGDAIAEAWLERERLVD